MMRCFFAGAVLTAAACAAPASRDARELTREAARCYADGQVARSLALAGDAIALEPDYLEAWFFRATVLAAGGRLDEAIRDFSEILRRSDAHPGALAGRALADLDLGRVDEALADADRLVALAPQSADTLLLRGYVRAHSGRANAGAEQDYAAARERGGEVGWQFYYNAGVRDFEMRRLSLAERRFEMAAALAPVIPEPHVALGRVRAEQRRYDRALTDYGHALQLRPADPEILYLRGSVFLAMRDLRRAIEDFNASIAKQPRAGVVFVARGLARRAANELDGAEADFTEAVRLDPQNRDAFRYRAQLRYDLGVLGDAERDYLAALAISATVEDVRGLARIYIDKEEFDRAVKLYEQALKLPAESALLEQMQLELEALRKRRTQSK